MVEKKEKKNIKKSEKYSIENDALKRKGKFCPKCGPGVFMAEHKDRNTCGNCGYTEKK
jgi:ubiquitin-small subunit ribosomal protein S27Ae